MLRRNLRELLPVVDREFLGVLLEAAADELLARRDVGSLTVRMVAWSLLDVDRPRPGQLRPIFSGDCAPEEYRARL
jgi:hypothetical protein